MKPLLRFSPLGHRVYVLTRYTTNGTAIIAQKKYDVTDDFLMLARTRGLVRRLARVAAGTKPEGPPERETRVSLVSVLAARNRWAITALRSIAANTCCEGCREAAKVAQAVLARLAADAKEADRG